MIQETRWHPRARPLALCLVVLSGSCLAFWCARKDSLASQIAGDSCDYAAEYEGEAYRCHDREWSWHEFGDPSLEANCQVDAARCVIARRDQDAVPALIRGLSEEVDEFDTGDGPICVRAEFAETLGVLGDPRAIEPLIEVLRHSGIAARTAAADALARFGTDASVAAPYLHEASRMPNPDDSIEVERLRSAARRALARVSVPP